MSDGPSLAGALMAGRDRAFPGISAPTSDTPAARLATRLAFLVAGFGIAAWAPLVPFAKARLGVDDGALGLLLLCLGIGSVAAVAATGPLGARYGARPLIVAGGVGLPVVLPALAVAPTAPSLGAALLLLAPVAAPALAGFALIGLGASNIVPVFFRRAGTQGAMPAGLAVAAVTTTGYAGVLAGPALVGFTAQAIGLPAAFWILAGLMTLVPLTARAAVGVR